MYCILVFQGFIVLFSLNLLRHCSVILDSLKRHGHEIDTLEERTGLLFDKIRLTFPSWLSYFGQMFFFIDDTYSKFWQTYSKNFHDSASLTFYSAHIVLSKIFQILGHCVIKFLCKGG